MSISNTTRKTAVMQGDETSVSFPFAFRINNQEDLKVYVKIGDGTYTLKTLGTDYILTDLTYDTNNNISGGNITLNSALTTSDYIYAIRETPNTQLESSEQVSFKSKDIERALDKATMQIQELSEDVSRSIRVEEWQTIDPDEILDAIFEAEGNAGTYATNASNSASAASTSENNASTYASNSQKWAEGTDEQVSALGGTHSAKEWAEQAATSVSSCADKSLSNLTAIGEAKFNAKVDLDGSNATFPHIVETYSNGDNWYRLWSDGWVEQGGKVSGNTTLKVTLLKTMSSTDYFVSLTPAPTGWDPTEICIWGRTTTDFYVGFQEGTNGGLWKAEGYAA